MGFVMGIPGCEFWLGFLMTCTFLRRRFLFNFSALKAWWLRCLRWVLDTEWKSSQQARFLRYLDCSLVGRLCKIPLPLVWTLPLQYQNLTQPAGSSIGLSTLRLGCFFTFFCQPSAVCIISARSFPFPPWPILSPRFHCHLHTDLW